MFLISSLIGYKSFRFLEMVLIATPLTLDLPGFLFGFNAMVWTCDSHHGDDDVAGSVFFFFYLKHIWLLVILVSIVHVFFATGEFNAMWRILCTLYKEEN